MSSGISPARPHLRDRARSASSAAFCNRAIGAVVGLELVFVFVGLSAQHVDALLILFDDAIGDLDAPVGAVLVAALLLAHAHDARFERANAQSRLAALALARLGQAEPFDQRPQRQPLQHQRDEDHAHGEE